MTIHLDEWAADVLARRSRALDAPVAVEGVRRAHLGPKLEVAAVSFVVEPSVAFSVSVEVSEGSSELAAFVRAAVFGFLDVVLVADPMPVRNILVRVVNIEVDPIDSSIVAFRRAGRAAGEHFLHQLRP